MPLPSPDRGSKDEGSVSLNKGLEDMNGVLLRVLGESVHDVRYDSDGQVWYQLRSSYPDDLKDSIKQYIKEYNKYYGTKLNVGFPKSFRLRLSEGSRPRKKRTSRPKAKDQEQAPDPQR